MKVLLTAINSQYVHSNLAIRYLRAFTQDLDYECILNEFTINDRRERVLEEILLQKPDVVAFSTYIWNVEYVEALARLIKEVNKDIQIIFGGPEVSYDSEVFLKNNVGEYVIDGEGEETYRELIKYLIKGYNKRGKSKNKDESFFVNEAKKLEDIKGLCYRIGDIIKYNSPREYMDLDKVIFPYTEQEDLSNKIVYYEASRGCPFRCKYCLSSTIHNVRFLDVERVRKELKFLIDKKVKLVKFVDRTFNCNTKFAIAIWEFLLSVDTDTKFHFEISADILNDDQINVLSKAPKGRFQFEVGVQTTNNEILSNINRNVNFEDIEEKVNEVKKFKNIMQHLDLIAGLPGEDYESFKKSFNDVYKLKPEEIQLGFLKLLKGSPMRKEAAKWGMKFSPYPPYEILKTKHISYKELVILKRVEHMVDKYYNTQKFNNIVDYFIGKFNSPFDFYYELSKFFYEKGYFKRSISSANYYKVFLEFNEEKLNDDNVILKEIVKFDYLRFNKKKWLPSFLDREFDKKIERNIRENIKNSQINIEKNNIHIERFNLNIFKYIEKCIIEFKDCYVLFDLSDTAKILELTDLYIS